MLPASGPKQEILQTNSLNAHNAVSAPPSGWTLNPHPGPAVGARGEGGFWCGSGEALAIVWCVRTQPYKMGVLAFGIVDASRGHIKRLSAAN
jgi:hypothetical protein